jgi:hypothetical protein
MAEAKRKAVTPPETEVVDGFTLTHVGHGKYSVEGLGEKVFPTRLEALAAIEDLKAVKAFEEEFGDTIPEGIEISSRHVLIRGTLIELPMNEMYLPDGSHNPYYDRSWHWGWGYAQGADIPTKQAQGFKVVTREQLDELVEAGLVPEHYRGLLMSVDHGNRLHYGDLVLMRIPRVMWRQRLAAMHEEALRRIRRTDAQNEQLFDAAGVKNISGPITNEVSTGLKMSGF